MNKFIVIMGVDGSGKSTIITELKDKIKVSYSFHFCPTNKYNKIGVINNSPHSKKPHSISISIIKIIYLFIHFFLGYLINIIKFKRKGHIIGDRYFYDVIIDLTRYRIHNKLNLSFIQYFIPKPDLLIFIDCSPKIILSRKKELTFDEIVRQRCELTNLIKKLNGHIIMNESKINLVINEIIKLIHVDE